MQTARPAEAIFFCFYEMGVEHFEVFSESLKTDGSAVLEFESVLLRATGFYLGVPNILAEYEVYIAAVHIFLGDAE